MIKHSLFLIFSILLLTGCVAGEESLDNNDIIEEETDTGTTDETAGNDTPTNNDSTDNDTPTDTGTDTPTDDTGTDTPDTSEDTPPTETTDNETCVDSATYFETNIWTPILTDCVVCHTSNGIAGTTDFTLVSASTSNYLNSNLTAFSNFVSITNGKIGAELILDKPTATVSHAGGQRLGMTIGNTDYSALQNMIARVETPVSCDETDTGSDTPTDDSGSTDTPTTGDDSTPPDTSDDQVCVDDDTFFETEIWNPILTDCVFCHVENGIAANTDYVLVPSTTSNYLTLNFTVLQNYAAITDGKVGSDLLLDKPTTTVAHGGGQRLGMTVDNEDYQNIQALLTRFSSPVVCETDDSETSTPANFFENVSLETHATTLRKAALLFAGRPPTTQEYAAVTAGGESALAATVRDFMTGDSFERFLMESANNHLLTNKYMNDQTPALPLFNGVWNYPGSEDRIDQIRDTEGEDAGNRAWARTSYALAQQPLRLIAHVVTEERPYSEVLTADYVMVNPWSNDFFNSGLTYANDEDDTDWREGQIRNYRLGSYPHAGLLTSTMFLNRFPSTATNRNRARARWAYKFFLGVDIEALAARPTDPDALADTNNPTMNNPNCTVCHIGMDPVAGAFQNWGDTGLYLEFDTDSLPYTYKESSDYTFGDRWYSDMRAPGFNGATLPTNSNDNSLQWLAQQIVADARFATGTVKFWYSSVFGTEPLIAPVESSDANYATRLRAYQEQNAFVEELATMFSAGTAGTASNGAFNLKDLLVEMVMSNYFRATSVSTTLDSERADELAEVGMFRLLTPEQLHRKIVSTTGFDWRPNWDGLEEYLDHSYLTTDYFTFYGGIDSDGITDRITDINALMYQVVTRMANENSCRIALDDFERDSSARILFPYVTDADLPTTTSGRDAIVANIIYLHERILGETLAADDPSILNTLGLFEAIYNRRITAGENTWWGGENDFCWIDWEDPDTIKQDPNHTIHSWIAVINLLLTDYRFIYL